MYIQCTQKLLAKLRRPYERLANPPLQHYCWHANYFEYQGIMFVVIMNDYSGDELFVQLESFQNFDLKFTEELQRSMEEAGIPAQDISTYLYDAGPIVFGPTGDRSQVAKLNGFTRRFKDFTINTLAFLDAMDELAEDEGISPTVGTGEEDYPHFDERPTPISTTQQKEQEGSQPVKVLMIHLDVELKLAEENKVTRSFRLPLETNFASLHEILQRGLGWDNTYFHEFDFSEHGFRVGESDRSGLHYIHPFSQQIAVHDEHTTMLSDLLPTIQRFTYLYDFADRWEHIIRVGDVEYVDGDLPLVLCTGGQGSVPPEDCGGVEGFAHLLKVRKDPTHPAFDEVKIWAEYDFSTFDRDGVNTKLAELEFSVEPL